MIYKYHEGMQIAHRGFVIIEGVKHFVNDGFVVCDNNLNHRSWNTTKKESTCKLCKDFAKKGPVQLNLFT